MPALIGYGIVVVLLAAFLLWVWYSDKLWYKQHPRHEQNYNAVDDEVWVAEQTSKKEQWLRSR